MECPREYQRLGDPSAPKCLRNLHKIYNKERIENREIAPNPSIQNRVSLQAGDDSVQTNTGGTDHDSLDTLPFHNMDGQDVDWDADGWAANWTIDYIDWPGDFASFRPNSTRDFE